MHFNDKCAHLSILDNSSSRQRLNTRSRFEQALVQIAESKQQSQVYKACVEREREKKIKTYKGKQCNLIFYVEERLVLGETKS